MNLFPSARLVLGLSTLLLTLAPAAQAETLQGAPATSTASSYPVPPSPRLSLNVLHSLLHVNAGGRFFVLLSSELELSASEHLSITLGAGLSAMLVTGANAWLDMPGISVDAGFHFYPWPEAVPGLWLGANVGYDSDFMFTPSWPLMFRTGPGLHLVASLGYNLMWRGLMVSPRFAFSADNLLTLNTRDGLSTKALVFGIAPQLNLGVAF